MGSGTREVNAGLKGTIGVADYGRSAGPVSGRRRVLGGLPTWE